jgi:hypothetical protein
MSVMSAVVPEQNIMTTARKVMPGDILLNKNGKPLVLITRAETLHSGRKRTRLFGEWLVTVPMGYPTVFERVLPSDTRAMVRRSA